MYHDTYKFGKIGVFVVAVITTVVVLIVFVSQCNVGSFQKKRLNYQCCGIYVGRLVANLQTHYRKRSVFITSKQVVGEDTTNYNRASGTVNWIRCKLGVNVGDEVDGSSAGLCRLEIHVTPRIDR